MDGVAASPTSCSVYCVAKLTYGRADASHRAAKNAATARLTPIIGLRNFSSDCFCVMK